MTERLSFDDLYGDQPYGPAPPPPRRDTTGLPSFDEQYLPAPAAPRPDVLLPPPHLPGTGLDYSDIGKGLATGAGEGLAGIVGFPGTVQDIARYGADAIGGKAAADAVPVPHWPSPPAIQQAVEQYTGPWPQPQTPEGKLARTGASYAPAIALPGGTLPARIANTALSAAGSEAAGSVYGGQPDEPMARFLAGLGVNVVGAKGVTPIGPTPPKMAAAAVVLDKAAGGYFPMMAGERRSPMLNWFESTAGNLPTSAGLYLEKKQAGADALNRYFTENAFDRAELTRRGVPPTANLPEAKVFDTGVTSLQDKYKALAAANPLPFDNALNQSLHAVDTNYQRAASATEVASGLKDINGERNKIFSAFVQGGGTIPGEVYQATRSALGDQERRLLINGNGPLSKAYGELKGALDQAMFRNLTPEDAAAWKANNLRYYNMKRIEGAVANAGGYGNLTGASLAQAQRSQRANQYAKGRSDPDQVAAAAQFLLKPLPNSGTATRTGLQQMYSLPEKALSSTSASSTAGAGVMGSLLGGGLGLGGPAGALIGATVPHIIAPLAVSRAGQAWLRNEIIPQTYTNIARHNVAQAALEQPFVQARNAQDQADIDQRTQAELRRMGLR